MLTKGWFAWLLTSIGMFFAMAPNVINQKVLQWYFRFAIVIFHVLVIMYWILFPIKAAQTGGFQSGSGVFKHFYNGINEGPEKQASDAYCWIISILFGAWVFYGYDASVHLAEETHEASEVVAKGMWMSTLSAWVRNFCCFLRWELGSWELFQEHVSRDLAPALQSFHFQIKENITD